VLLLVANGQQHQANPPKGGALRSDKLEQSARCRSGSTDRFQTRDPLHRN